MREKTIATTTSIFETYTSGIWTTIYSNIFIDTSYTWYSNDNIGLVSVTIQDGEVINASYTSNIPLTAAPNADFSFTNLGNGVIDFSDNSSNLPTD